MSSEEYQQLLQLNERKNKEAREKAFRFENRKSMDELMRQILNGDLFDVYDGVKKFPQVPLSFEDHEEYRRLWHYLFAFELLSQIRNGRRDVAKDVLGLAGHEMHNHHTNKQTMWVGYCVIGK